MNKIYKVVFNETTQTWVAVGEDAKAKKTSASSLINSLPDNSFKSKFLSLAVAMAVISPLTINEAKADNVQKGGTYTYGNNPPTDVINFAEGNSIAFGDGAVARGGSKNASIAIGRGAKAAKYPGKDNEEEKIDGAIAIGDNAWAITPYSVVIGSGVRGQQGLGGREGAKDTADNGGYSVSIGRRSATFTTNGGNSYYANTKNSTAIGFAAHTHAANALAIGYSTDATAERSFALGTARTGLNNEADKNAPEEEQAVHKGARAGGQGSIVVGDTAIAYFGTSPTDINITVNDAIAMGTGSWAQTQNSVVLGGGISYTYHTPNASNSVDIHTKYYNTTSKAWQDNAKGLGATVGTNSIGGVAIGGASADSVFDATKTGNLNYPYQAPTNDWFSATATKPATIGTNSSRAVALGSGSKVGDYAQWSFAAAGGQVETNANESIAIGHNANVTYQNSVAIGTNAKVANANQPGSGTGGVAIGATSVASGGGAIAIGGQDGISTWGEVSADKGAYATGQGSIVIGVKSEAVLATIDGDGYVKRKAGSTGWEDEVTGHFAIYNRTVDPKYVKGDHAGQMIVIGDSSAAYGDQSIVLGANVVAAGNASIAIGGDDVGRTVFSQENGQTVVSSQKLGQIQDVLLAVSEELTKEGYDVPITLHNATTTFDAYTDRTFSKGEGSAAFGIKAIAEGDLSYSFGIASRTVGNSSIAFGTTANTGADNSIAIGTATSTGSNAQQSTAVGYMSQTGGKLNYTTPVEYTAKVNDQYANISLSTQTGTGLHSVAVGMKNKVLGENSTAVGQGNVILGNNSGAFGDPSIITANNSYVVGNNNILGDGSDIFAFGNNINATANKSVFLGSNSAYVKANAESEVKTGTTAGLTKYDQNYDAIKANNINAVILQAGDLKFAGANATGVVSVGSAGAERRIQNVAAGLISANSTDAINGSQLYAVVQESTPIFFNAPNATGSQAASGTSPASVKVGQNVYNLSWTAADGNGVSAPIYGGDTLTIKGKNNNIKVNFDANSQTYTLDADYSVNLTGSDVNSIDPGQHISTQPKTNADGSKNLVVDVRTGGISPKDDGSVVPNTSNGHVALVGDVANSINNSGWNTTLTDGTTALINPADTVNYVDGKGTKANVTKTTANGQDVVNVSYDINVKSDLTNKDITQPIASGADSTVLNLDNVTNANTTPATVSDLQNYGWVVSTNGVDNAAIRNGYTVNFKADNNSGLTAQSSYDSATNTYNVQYGINKAQDPSITNTVGDSTKPAGVVNGGAANQYWDSQQVQNAINQSGWVVGVGKNANGNDKLINADNNRVGLVNGNNIHLTQDGSNFTIASTIDMVAGDTHYREGNHTQLSFSNEPDPKDPNKTINVAKVNVTTGGLSASDGTTTNRDLVPTSNGNFQVVDSAPVAMGAVAYDGSEGSVATIQQVANAVNNAGWLTTLSDGSTAIINPADKVNYVNGNGTKANVTTTKENGQDVVNVSYDIDVVGGKNISVTKDPNGGSTLTVATNPDVDFDSVNINKGLTVQPNANINMGGNQIHNVAAGTADTDAVNVAQLKDFVIGGTDVDGNKKITYQNVTTPDGKTQQIIVNVNGDPLLRTYNAVGDDTHITNSVAEAIYNINEYGIKAIHVNDGTPNPTPEAKSNGDSQANGRYSIAIGHNAIANGNDSITIGTGGVVDADGAVAIGDPIVITQSAANAVAVGSNSSATVANSVSLGSFSTTNRQAIVGTPAVAVGDNTGAVNADGTVNTVFVMPTSDQSAIQAVAATATSTLGAVSVGSATQNRQITGVAAGSADNDAVNVAQLKSAMGTVNNQMANLNHHIDDVDKNARAGTAAAMAVAGLPQAYLPGKSLMAVGAGTFRGQTGYAIGVSSISDGGNWIIKGTASGNSQGHFGATAAIGYQW